MRLVFCQLIAVVAGIAFPAPAFAQTEPKLPRVDFVAVGFGADTAAFDAIRDELRTLGQVEGRTFSIDLRASDDLKRVPELARDIVRSAPDVIVSINTRIVPALQSLTQRIPIVVAFHSREFVGRVEPRPDGQHLPR